MVELIRGLRAEVVRANLEHVQRRIEATGRNPATIEVLAATKYLPADELDVLAQAGVKVVGENRAQDLLAKQETNPQRFTWDFIGQLQSRKVRELVGRVRYIHSVASESALRELERHGSPATQVLIELNIAGEIGKNGIAPDELPRYLERCSVPVVGLMTMPPLTSDPEASRPLFRALRELASAHGLPQLSMGTSQDYVVAVEEGATIVRLGNELYAPRAGRGAS